MVVHGKVKQNKIKFEPSHVFCRYEYSTSSSIQKSSTHGLQSSNHSLQSSNHGIHSSSHGLQSSNHALQSSNYGLQSSTNTQQSIKKNINDLDHLLNNLSSHNSSRDVSVMQFDGLNQGCIL